MRPVSIAFALLVAVSAAQTRTSDAPISGRPPAVFWKRSMTASPATSKNPPASGALSAPAVPKPEPSREVLMQHLAELKTGSSRTEVIQKLGAPAYSIGMPEGEHYFERCRFRAGGDSIASIELRDGLVTAILVE